MRAGRLQRGKKTPLRADGLLLLAAAGLVFGACAAPIEGREEQTHMGREIQPIVGGIASGADQDSVVALARFENGARVGLCTATMVAANLALTARHCVSATDATAACNASGQPVAGALLHGDRVATTLAVYATTGGVAPDTTIEAGASAHGKTLVVDADATTICNHDLAFVILDTALASPISPMRLAAPAAADPLVLVGFGITELGSLPAQRMRRDGVSLVGAGPMAYPDDPTYGVGDGELLVGESACSGDSGSPAFTPLGAVVAVASRAGNGKPHDPANAASTCLGPTAHAVYAELAANQTLTLRAFAEAGATPWLEGQPDPRTPKDAGAPGSSSGGAGSGSSGNDTLPPSASGAANANGNGAQSGAAPSGDGMLDPSGARTSATTGGCSASGEPTHGAVEDALGIVFLFLLVLRFRSARRLRDAGADAVAADAAEKARIPYVDLGMRESFASLSDERWR
ncbi:MAG: hypothetical protein QOI41_1505 [Myxococcales bacterium]|nr:hypothetical protein [Myxococcales bacterium]